MSILEEIFDYPFLIKIFDKLLTDKEKINMISINKYLNNKKYKLKFYNNKKCYPNDQKYWYFDCLTKIEIGISFRLPKFVKYLKINETNKFIKIGNFPETVTHYHFDNGSTNFVSAISIPHSCKHLYIKNLSCQHDLSKNVTHLEIDSYDDSIFHVPKSITHLKINCKIRFIESKTLTHLELKFDYNTILNTPNLKCVTFESLYNLKFIDSLPSSVKYLKFKSIFPSLLNLLNLSNIERIKFNAYCETNFPPHIKISYYNKINDLSIAGFKYN